MELLESLQEESLLLVVSEHKSLDGLSGVVGASSNGLDGGETLGSTLGVLSNLGRLMVLFVTDSEDVLSSVFLLRLGFGLNSGETVSLIGSEALGGGVEKSGQVHWIGREALFS